MGYNEPPAASTENKGRHELVDRVEHIWDQAILALPSELPLPRLITDAGDKASWRFINFFTAEIENDNTRAAYYRAMLQFDTWCQTQGVGLHQLQPFLVAAYARELKATRHPQYSQATFSGPAHALAIAWSLVRCCRTIPLPASRARAIL
jgi:hypothetical protein